MFLADLAINDWATHRPLTTINETTGVIDIVVLNHKFPLVQLVISINLDAKFTKLMLDYIEGRSYTWLLEEGLPFPTADEINQYADSLIKEPKC